MASKAMKKIEKSERFSEEDKKKIAAAESYAKQHTKTPEKKGNWVSRLKKDVKKILSKDPAVQTAKGVAKAVKRVTKSGRTKMAKIKKSDVRKRIGTSMDEDEKKTMGYGK